MGGRGPWWLLGTRAHHFPPWAASVTLSAALAGAICLSLIVVDRDREVYQERLEQESDLEVEARLTGFPRPSRSIDRPNRIRVTAQTIAVQAGVTWRQMSVPVVMFLDDTASDLVPGAVVQLSADLTSTSSGDRAVWLAFGRGPPVVMTGGSRWGAVTGALREGLREAVAPLPGHAGLIPGIALGDDAQVPPPLVTAMRTTSLGHLLAVSGAHIAVLLGLTTLFTGWLPRLLRVAVSGVILVGLLALVGPEPSVLRAVTMGSVGLLASLLGRPAAAVPALAATVIVLLLLDPWLARELGFLLSVLATAGIMAWAPRWSSSLARRMGAAGFLAPAIAVPAAAQVACLPVLVTVESGLATYGVVANLAVAPVIPALTVLSLGATLTSGAWADGAHLLVWCAQAATWWIEVVATSLARLPLSRVPWPSGAVGAALIVTVIVSLVRLPRLAEIASQYLEYSRRKVTLVAASTLSLMVTAAIGSGVFESQSGAVSGMAWDGPPRGWRVIACDVGQGSATVISTATSGGGRRAIVVDVGPPDGNTAQCLAGAGIELISTVVITHADLDHRGGLDEVLRGFEVVRVVMPDTADPRLSAVATQVRTWGVDVEWVSAGTPPWREDGLEVSVGWPTARALELGAGTESVEEDGNDLSLSLGVLSPDLSVVVHGDQGASAQAQMWAGISQGLEGSVWADPDVVVIPHHGSVDQSSELLTGVVGTVSIVSAGRDNRYGHPHPDTIAALARVGSTIVRTDECGSRAVRRRDLTVEVSACPQAMARTG